MMSHSILPGSVTENIVNQEGARWLAVHRVQLQQAYNHITYLFADDGHAYVHLNDRKAAESFYWSLCTRYRHLARSKHYRPKIDVQIEHIDATQSRVSFDLDVR